jgi:hypothetical protein
MQAKLGEVPFLLCSISCDITLQDTAPHQHNDPSRMTVYGEGRSPSSSNTFFYKNSCIKLPKRQRKQLQTRNVYALGTASRNARGDSRHPNTRIDPELQAPRITVHALGTASKNAGPDRLSRTGLKRADPTKFRYQAGTYAG